MAEKQVKFSEYVISIARPSAPTTWIAPCGARSRGLNRSKEVVASMVGDCDDETKPAVTENDVSTTTWEIPFSGVVERDAIDVWDEFFDSTEAWPVRVVIAGTGALGGRTRAGLAHLTSFNETGERYGRMTLEATLTGHGILTTTESA